MVEQEFEIAQFFLMLPLFGIAFLIEWGFIQWIIQRRLMISLIATTLVSFASYIVAAIFLVFFEVVTYSSADFVMKFSMGIEGFANLFWLMIAIWAGSFLLDFILLKPTLKLLTPPPPPNPRRQVLGLLWANFFSAPLLTFIVWLLQF